MKKRFIFLSLSLILLALCANNAGEALDRVTHSSELGFDFGEVDLSEYEDTGHER